MRRELRIPAASAGRGRCLRRGPVAGQNRSVLGLKVPVGSLFGTKIRFGVGGFVLRHSRGFVPFEHVAQPAHTLLAALFVGGRRFDVELTGDNVNATRGVADVKPVDELRIVGQSVQRYDIPPKVDGSLTWAVDVKLPGMVHARNVKPPVAGAQLRGIDESSVADLPGFVRVVSRGNYVAVVCEREEQAIRAAEALQVDWAPPAQAPFPASDELFDFIRAATPTSTSAAMSISRSRQSS